MSKDKFVITFKGKPLAPGPTKYLDRLPPGVLITTKELAAATGLSTDSFTNDHTKFLGYSVRYGGRRAWGSKQTVKKAEAILADDN